MKGTSTSILLLLFAACGPTAGNERDCGSGLTDLNTDPMNCGQCTFVCGTNESCHAGKCTSGICEPGKTEDCYDGQDGTKGVGPCTGGTHTCGADGNWSQCMGEVVPVQEKCGNGIDDNCNGKTDEDEDADGDGFTTCGGDCCDSTECSNPGAVNPGAFDAPGNNFDDDCDGMIDNTITLCDQTLTSNSNVGMDYAKAIDLCQQTTMTDKKWGVIDAQLTLPSGSGTADPNSHSIRHKFGSGVMPQGGLSMAILSTGAAAAKGDTNPNYVDFDTDNRNETSALPTDFLAANGGKVPNAPGCPGPNDNLGHDPVMLQLQIRVPTNAHSFKLSTNFFSAEFPEWTCTAYNDFFVVLLDSAYTGDPANPADKNLAFYSPPSDPTKKYPVGVNLAFGNTGLFTQCVNGSTGCAGGTPGTISTCMGTQQLMGTGFDDSASGTCDGNSLKGGGTGWLVTSGNVKPGEIIKLRIAIWDTSDGAYDSLAVIDGFQWSVDSTQPGTVIFDHPVDLPPFNPLQPQFVQ